MEDAGAKTIPKQREQPNAKNPHIKAVTQRHGNSSGDALLIPNRLGLRHGGKKQNRHGVGDGGRKQDKRQRHTGEDAVNAERLGAGQPKRV